MKTKITAYGRRGRYQIEPQLYFREWTFSLEPWGGIYYLFHGCGLPLIFENVVGNYRDHRVRAALWNAELANDIWVKTGDFWKPVIDWVYEIDIKGYISFKFHPTQIVWIWQFQAGDSKSIIQPKLDGLAERFEILGEKLQKNLKSEPLAGENASRLTA